MAGLQVLASPGGLHAPCTRRCVPNTPAAHQLRAHSPPTAFPCAPAHLAVRALHHHLGPLPQVLQRRQPAGAPKLLHLEPGAILQPDKFPGAVARQGGSRHGQQQRRGGQPALHASVQDRERGGAEMGAGVGRRDQRG